jgi:hypothetical protein
MPCVLKRVIAYEVHVLALSKSLCGLYGYLTTKTVSTLHSVRHYDDMNLKGSGAGLIELLSRGLLGGTGKAVKPRIRIAIVLTEF